jgi:hypothetical protein
VAAAASTTTADQAAAATVRGVPFLGRSAYVTLPVLSDAAQLYRFSVFPAGTTTAALSARPDVPGLPFTAASASGPALDAVAGVRQGRSVLSLFVFPAAATGTPTAPTMDLIPDQMPPRP